MKVMRKNVRITDVKTCHDEHSHDNHCHDEHSHVEYCKIDSSVVCGGGETLG